MSQLVTNPPCDYQTLSNENNVNETDYRTEPGYRMSDFAVAYGPDAVARIQSIRTETAAMLTGRTLHAYLLERDKFDQSHVIYPDSKVFSAKLKKEHAAEGLTPVKERTLKTAKIFEQSKTWSDLYDRIETVEHCFLGDYAGHLHESQRIGLKCRVDALTQNEVIDLKFVKEAHYSKLPSLLRFYHYDVSIAMQAIMARKQQASIIFISKEKKPIIATVYVDIDQMESDITTRMQRLAEIDFELSMAESEPWAGEFAYAWAGPNQLLEVLST